MHVRIHVIINAIITWMITLFYHACLNPCENPGDSHMDSHMHVEIHVKIHVRIAWMRTWILTYMSECDTSCYNRIGNHMDSYMQVRINVRIMVIITWMLTSMLWSTFMTTWILTWILTSMLEFRLESSLYQLWYSHEFWHPCWYSCENCDCLTTRQQRHAAHVVVFAIFVVGFFVCFLRCLSAFFSFACLLYAYVLQSSVLASLYASCGSCSPFSPSRVFCMLMFLLADLRLRSRTSYCLFCVSSSHRTFCFCWCWHLPFGCTIQWEHPVWFVIDILHWHPGPKSQAFRSCRRQCSGNRKRDFA